MKSIGCLGACGCFPVSRAAAGAPGTSFLDPDQNTSTLALDRLHRQKQAEQPSQTHGYSPTTVHTQVQAGSASINASINGASAINSTYKGPAVKVQQYHLAALATYWFGWSFLWLPLLIVIIPYQVRDAKEARKIGLPRLR
jgi:hypothetical protein